MPHITLSVDLGSQDPEFKQYEISLDSTVGDLKGLVNGDFGLPVAAQQIWFNGDRLTSNAQKLQEAGIADQDLLNVVQSEQDISRNAPTNVPAGTQEATVDQQIEQVRRDLLQRTSDPRQRQAMAQQAPALEAVLNDPVRFREAFLAERNAMGNSAAQGGLDMDDMSEEGQAKIMDAIRQERVGREADRAMDEHPELFGRVTMLYVQLEVNGHPVKAFVDSGAQATIMSPSCAETCGVTKSIDTRFAGIARGVGTAKILGRVHLATIKIGDADELPCSFTVMEGKDVDMLLGLDMLKRYQACIDLKQNKLILGGSVSVPFLGESEIPKNFEEAIENEPTVPGPSGTAIGAQSGAVKLPASTSSASDLNFAGQGRTLGSASVPATGSVSQASQPAQNSPALSRSQQQTPSRQQVPPRPSAPTPGQAQFPEASIELLIGLGATREQAIQLLRRCNGNAEYAAGLLFEQ